MPTWIPALLVMAVFTLGVAIFALTLFRELRNLLILLFISLFLSVALEPGVNWLAAHGWKPRGRRGWKRGTGAGVIFLSLLVVAGTFIGLMIPLIIDQSIELVDRLPGYIDDLGEVTSQFGLEISSERAAEALTNLDTSLNDVAGDVAGSVFGVGTTLLGTVFQLLTIGLFTFYLTADGPRFRRTVLSALPPERQREVLRVWEIAIDKTGGYFYSRALLAGIGAAVAWIVFLAIGVPFALPLALWVGIFSQFVPVVGTYIGGALPALIALLDDIAPETVEGMGFRTPGKAIAVIVYIVIYQQIENYLLSPRITARTMSLHPAVSFGSAIAGATLLGAPGALMALPVAATIQAFISTYIHRYDVIEELQD